MYCDHFKLQCLPFEDRADRRFFVSTADRDETLAALEYEIQSGKGMSLLLGSAGTGKTALIRVLLRRLDASIHAVVLSWPMVGSPDLIRETAKSLGVTLPPSHQESRRLARLRRHLSRVAGKGRRCVLIIDQAENLSSDNLTQLAALADLEHKEPRALRIILAGQPHIRTLLGKPVFARIAQQLFGERVLSTFSLEETERYVTHRLRVAGAENTSLFTKDAISLIHDESNGVPRLINHMCNASLVAAYGAGAMEITSDLVRGAEGRDEVRERSMSKSAVGAGRGAPAVVAPSRKAIPVAVEFVASETNGAAHAAHDSGPSMEMCSGSRDSDGPVSEEATSHLLLTLSRLELAQGNADATLGKYTAVEKHMATLTTAADRLIGQLGGAVKQAARSQESLERGVEERIRRAEQRADEVESRLQRVLSATADACEQTSEIGQARAEAISTGRQEISSISEQVSKTSADAQRQLRVTQSALGDTQIEAGRIQETIVSEILSRARQALEKQTAEAIKQHREFIAAARETQRKEIAGVITEAAAEVERVKETIAARRKEMEKEVEEYRRASAESLTTLDNRIRNLKQEYDTLEKQGLQAEQSLASIRFAIQTSKSQADELTKLRARGVETIQSLSPLIERSSSMLPQAQETCTQIEKTQRGLATTLQELSAGIEKVRELQGQAAELKGIADRLAGERSSGERMVEHIEKVIATGEQVAQRTQACSEQAAKNAERLDSITEAARHMLDETQTVIAHADEKTGRLASHSAAATNVLRSLAEATTRGHDAVKQIDEAKRDLARQVDENRQKLERLAEQIWEMGAQADSTSKALVANSAEATSIVEAMESVVPDARQTADRLVKHVNMARDVAAQIEERCEQAGELKDRLQSIADLLSAAQESESAVRSVCEEVQTTHARLREIAATSDGTEQKLDELTSTAHGQIETYKQMRQEAENASRRLAAQLNATQKSVEVGEPMLSEFISQSRSIERQLGALGNQAKEIEQVIAKATSTPMDIITNAQAQADQLERVCAAVRNVFTGVSRASLDAKNQMEACTRASALASKQVSTLSIQTDQSIAIMREWIEEALRAQSRLEKTLAVCPKIHDTHSAAVMRRAAQGMSSSIHRLADPSAEAELTVMENALQTRTELQDKTATPPPRAREISSMIADAKRSAVEPST